MFYFSFPGPLLKYKFLDLNEPFFNHVQLNLNLQETNKQEVFKGLH